jgi:hypothetical protein
MYIVKVTSAQGTSHEKSYKPRKNESMDRYMTRVYNAISEWQRECLKAVKFEIFNNTLLVDTFYGLLDN